MLSRPNSEVKAVALCKLCHKRVYPARPEGLLSDNRDCRKLCSTSRVELKPPDIRRKSPASQSGTSQS
eukprot:6491566-Amphidinium_carterae.1